MGAKTSLSRSQQRLRFWRKIIAAQPRSGMSVHAWCGVHGVSAPSFYAWRQKLAKRAARRKSRRPPLLPVQIIPSVGGESVAPLEIELPSRTRLRVRPGCELELFRQVLTMLRQDRQEAPGC